MSVSLAFEPAGVGMVGIIFLSWHLSFMIYSASHLFPRHITNSWRKDQETASLPPQNDDIIA